MRAAIIRSMVVVSALLLSACELTPQRQEAAVEAAAEVQPACECPVVELPVEACPTAPEVEPEIEEAEPAPAAVAPCVAPAPAPVAKPGQGHLIIGRVENVFLKLSGNGKKTLKLKARIDTGAGLSSVHAHDLMAFERDGEPWVRFSLLEQKTKKSVTFERPVRRYTQIKQLNGESQRRPVVSISLTLGGIEENLDVTLTDRTGYVYPVLIGRNLLRDRMVVDVSRKFIAERGLRLD